MRSAASRFIMMGQMTSTSGDDLTATNLPYVDLRFVHTYVKGIWSKSGELQIPKFQSHKMCSFQGPPL
jgi:hypothetical protein